MSEPSPTHPYGQLLDTSLRVLTWNVWGRFGDWQGRYEAIIRTLDSADPDIVVLEESWHGPDASQPARLAERLGFHQVFASDRSEDSVDQGVAILSRWPYRATHATELPSPRGHQPRAVLLFAEVDGPRGPISIYGTHLAPYFHRGAVRNDQVQALGQTVAAGGPYAFPPIVCGDFNAAPDSDEIRRLTGRGPLTHRDVVFLDAWDMAGDGAGHTVSQQNPNAAPLLIPDVRWDYVFVGWPSGAHGAGHPLRAWLEGTQEVDGQHPSDHYALVVDLRY